MNRQKQNCGKSFEKLFTPISIGSITVKNRIVMSAMTTDYGNEDQTPSEKLIDYLAARAKGGVGLITVEVCTVDVRHRYLQRSLSLGDDSFIAKHKVMVDRLHQYGAKVQPQITHPGPESLAAFYEKMPAIGPSPVVSPIWGGVCRQLEIEELTAITEQYGLAAKRARAAGYDGMELHAAHSYHLLGSFLSPWRNKRTDEYGGNKLETRMRLLLEVIASIKKHVGDDFPITLRLSGYERAPGGGEIQDTQIMAPILVQAGISAFHISGGVSDKLVSQIVASSQTGDGYNAANAAAIKQVVNVPIITVGRIHTPELAEKMLQQGETDLIAMGRPLLADAEWANKAKQGISHTIRRCISCENCIDSMNRGTLHCAVNGLTGRESELTFQPISSAKHIVIVGGGPAGMETARLCALKGHKVTLLERSAKLGGSLVLASTVHSDNEHFLKFLLQQIASLNIDVRLNTTATLDLLTSLKPDKIVIATGAVLETQTIPGSTMAHVISGEYLRKLMRGETTDLDLKKFPMILRPVLKHFGHIIPLLVNPSVLRFFSKIWLPMGKRVIIIGADLAAVELAEFLLHRKRAVTIITSSKKIAPEVGRKRRTEHMDKLDALGVHILADVNCQSISKEGVAIKSSTGYARLIATDSVIIAGEPKANTTFFELVKKAFPDTVAIGDCTGLGLIVKAVADATRIAHEF